MPLNIFLWAVFTIAVYIYWNRERRENYLYEFSKRLIKITIGFYILYAAFLTWGQYYIWSQDSLGRIFLTSDRFGVMNGRPGYFLFYSYLRFWLAPAITILAGFLFYLFLKSLRKYRERFFEEGEPELGFLCAIVAGWPGFVVFLPLVFMGVVLVSIFRLFVFKEHFTTLGWPFLISTLVVLVCGEVLIDIFGLRVLYI